MAESNILIIGNTNEFFQILKVLARDSLQTQSLVYLTDSQKFACEDVPNYWHMQQMNEDQLRKVGIISKKGFFDAIIINIGADDEDEFIFPQEQVKNNFLLKFTAQINIIKLLLPLLTTKGKVGIVSSIMCALDLEPQHLKDKIISHIPQEELIQIVASQVEGLIEKGLCSYSHTLKRKFSTLINLWAHCTLPLFLAYQQKSILIHNGFQLGNTPKKNPLKALQKYSNQTRSYGSWALDSFNKQKHMQQTVAMI